MKTEELIKNKKWRLLGRWRQTALSEIEWVRALVQTTAAYDFYPEAYIVLNHGVYVAADEMDRHAEFMRGELIRNPSEVSRKIAEVVEKATKETGSYTFETLDPVTLGEYIKQAAKHVRIWYEIMVVDAALMELYPKSLPAEFTLAGIPYTPQSLFAKAALPKKTFPIVEERSEILKIAIRAKKGEDVSADVAQHTEVYGWMNSLCWYTPPFDVRHYEAEIKKLILGNPGEELEELKRQKIIRTKNAEILLAEVREKYPVAWEYLDVVRDMADLREESWDAVSIAGQRNWPAFVQYAREKSITYNQLMSHSPEEFEALLRGEHGVDVDLLNRRIKNFAVIAYKKEVTHDEGPIVDEYEKLLDMGVTDSDTLEGMSVWGGKVTGHVRVLRSVDDLHTMEEGEILVCSMTDPDYMPAIHRAKAVVTDQGGMLCHAAIVAREFEIPCIVGTEVATKIFKNGDMVEVDANNGVVRKL